MSVAKNTRKVGLGLLGSGTVGEALQDLLFRDLGKRPGADLELEIVKIYTRRPQGKRWYARHRALFTSSAEEVIDHPRVDILVEALGSQQEKQLQTYKSYIIRAFEKGKSVVTSDKAVLARFGKEIWSAAERCGRELRFEACVGGGIPIIRSLTESFAAEEPESIYGIVNGTCNYILSEMKRSGKSYEAALREAQERGYAESDPKADTAGLDAEAKLILLAGVTFGVYLQPGIVWRKGIEEIQAIDFLYADRKGRCTIKPLAAARREDDVLSGFVAPVLVPHDHFLATIDGSTNAIFFKGKRSAGGDGARDWNYVFVGPGAGGGPTAVAILGDVCELARRRGSYRITDSASRYTGQHLATALTGAGKALTVKPADQIAAPFYIRFLVKDRPGIVGDICQTFGKMAINVSEIWQLSHGESELRELAKSHRLSEKPGRMLPFVITLERATAGQIRTALDIIGRKDYLLVEPVWFPIWRN